MTRGPAATLHLWPQLPGSLVLEADLLVRRRIVSLWLITVLVVVQPSPDEALRRALVQLRPVVLVVVDLLLAQHRGLYARQLVLDAVLRRNKQRHPPKGSFNIAQTYTKPSRPLTLFGSNPMIL